MTAQQNITDREQVCQRLRTILVGMVGADAENVNDDTQLFAELGLDSTNALELLMTVEDEFGIEFDPTTLEHTHLETFGSLTRYLFNQTGL